MRETIKDPARLIHIIESINNVNSFLEGKSPQDLIQDKLLFFAVVKNIEIIGEAAYKLSREFTEAHPQTPWQDIIAMRHVLVHGYYQVSSIDLFDVYTSNLPELLTQVEQYLAELTD